MNWGYQLITAVLETRDIKTLLESGVTRDILTHLSPELGFAYDILLQWYHNESHYGEVMSKELFIQRFPRFQLIPPAQGIESLIELVTEQYLVKRGSDLIDEASRSLQTNPRKTLEILSGTSQNLLSGTDGAGDIDFGMSAYDTIKNEYQTIKSSKGLVGYPWPWAYMNKHTPGMLKGDFMVIYGIPKSMKTWVALYLCAWLFTRRHRVVIFAKEMRKDTLIRRLALILAKIPSLSYQKGSLTDEEEKRLLSTLYSLKQMQEEESYARIKIIDTSKKLSPKNVQDLARKCESIKPSVLFVDSAYLLESNTGGRSMDWKNITGLVHDLKNLTHTIPNLPLNVICTTQENPREQVRSGKRGQASMSFSQAFNQEADMTMHIIKQKNSEDGQKELCLLFPATREYEIPEFTINAMAGDNFSYKKAGVKLLDEDQFVNEGNSFDKPGKPVFPVDMWMGKKK